VQRKFFDDAAKVLQLQDLSGWYRHTAGDLIELGGTTVYLHK
jgi:hypothetical protein